MLIALPHICEAQQPVDDSLRQLSRSTKHDTIRIQAMVTLGENNYPTQLDSCLVWWKRAIAACDKSLKNAQGKTKHALLVEKGASLSNIAFVNSYQGNIHSALDYNFKALRVRESINDIHGIAESNNNIAWLYLEQSDTSSAIKCFQKSRKYYQKINDMGGVAYTGINMSRIYLKAKKNSLALESLYEAENILKDLPHLKEAWANSINFIGVIHNLEFKRNAAKKYFNKALAIRKSINDINGLASSYTTLARYFDQTNKPDSAFICGKLAIENAQRSTSPDAIEQAALIYSEILKKRKDFERSLEFYALHIQMRDSLNNDKTKKSTIKNQFKYSYETKAATDSLKHFEENKIKEERLEKEKYQRYILYGGLILVLVFLIFVYSRFRIIRTQKVIIEQQKLIVDVKNKEMLDSMDYARQIQGALLPSAKMIQPEFSEHFIFYKPKDIVSGDFYWSTKKQEGDFYLAVCDSTGHGVPGAFMSLLNISFLNEAVIEKEIAEPHEVLNYVRQRLISTISQEGRQDGMDATLICYNKKKMLLSYSSAHNRGLLVRRGIPVEMKADKMPVGKGEIHNSFSKHIIEVIPGDRLYFYTDGFPDQFGGPKGKKFKTGTLNKLLASVSLLSMKEQEDILVRKFEEWQGEYEQLDDVCLIGIMI